LARARYLVDPPQPVVPDFVRHRTLQVILTFRMSTNQQMRRRISWAPLSPPGVATVFRMLLRRRNQLMTPDGNGHDWRNDIAKIEEGD
jgi:hypothetical protein